MHFGAQHGPSHISWTCVQSVYTNLQHCVYRTSGIVHSTRTLHNSTYKTQNLYRIRVFVWTCHQQVNSPHKNTAWTPRGAQECSYAVLNQNLICIANPWTSNEPMTIFCDRRCAITKIWSRWVYILGSIWIRNYFDVSSSLRKFMWLLFCTQNVQCPCFLRLKLKKLGCSAILLVPHTFPLQNRHLCQLFWGPCVFDVCLFTQLSWGSLNRILQFIYGMRFPGVNTPQ